MKRGGDLRVDRPFLALLVCLFGRLFACLSEVVILCRYGIRICG